MAADLASKQRTKIRVWAIAAPFGRPQTIYILEAALIAERRANFSAAGEIGSHGA